MKPRGRDSISFLRSVVAFSMSSWIGFIIGIASVPVLTRLLSPEQFAIVNQFLAATNLMMGIAFLGLDSAFVRYYFEPPEGLTSPRLLGTILLDVVAIIGAAGILTLPGYSRIAQTLFGEGISAYVLPFFFCAVVAQAVIRLFSIHYRMINSSGSYTLLAVSLQLVTKFAVLVSLPFGLSRNSLIVATSAGLAFLAFVVLAKNIGAGVVKLKAVRMIHESEFIRYSLSSWPIPVTIYANVYLSQIAVRESLGGDLLGIFLSANVFASILAVFQSGFANYWSGYMFANYQKAQEKIIRVHDFICLFSVLALVGLVLLRDIAYFFIGPKFAESKRIFALVACTPLFGLMVETTAYGTSIAKKAQYPLVSYSLMLVVNFVATLALAPRLGLLGPALAAFLSSAGNLVLQTYWGQKYYRSMRGWGALAFSVAAMSIVAIINYLPIDSLAAAGLCVVVAAMTLAFFPAEVRELYRLFVAIVRR